MENMMNKRKAKEQAQNNTRSIGELLQLVKNKRGKGGMSKLNPAFTLEEILDIFEKPWENKDPNEIPKGMKYSARKGYEIMSLDGIGIWNLLRECG